MRSSPSSLRSVDRRLRRRQDFVAVLRSGRRYRHHLLTLGVRPNGLPNNRYGYAIGKRIGSAVVRNRVRRRLREIVRALPLLPGHDLVITANDGGASATFEELRGAVASCAARGGLLEGAGPTREDLAMSAKTDETS